MGLTFMAELAAAGLAFVAPFRLTTQGNPPEANASQQVLDSAKVSGWAPGVLAMRKAYNAMQGHSGTATCCSSSISTLSAAADHTKLASSPP